MDRAGQISRSRDAIREELAKGAPPDPIRLAGEMLNIGVGIANDLARIAAALERIAYQMETTNVRT